MTEEKMAEEYLEELRQKKIPFDIYEVNNQLKIAFIAGLNKANEWHYTKYELPPEDVPLLCMRGGNVYVAWFILGKWKGDKYNDVKKPYAWREVKLPEPGLQIPMQEG